MSNNTDDHANSSLEIQISIIISAGPAKAAGLSIDLVRFKTWLHENFAVLEWERIETPRPHYEFAIDFPLEADPAFQIEGLVYEDTPKEIAFGSSTPRFTGAFLTAFAEHFPENTDIITIVDDRFVARFDASLDERDAAAHVMSHDDALARQLAGN